MEKFPNFHTLSQEKEPKPKVEVEPIFADFIPQGFRDDPVGYFEREGKNIKTGEIKYDDAGRVREDPTAVKDLPTWRNGVGVELQIVGRRVNIEKGMIAELQDPFYEYGILEKLAQIGLPAARPIAKAEDAGTHIIIMERIPGLRWSEKGSLNLKERGYSEEDIAALMNDAEQKMEELKVKFQKEGVIRSWKLKDMVFQIDFENKKIDALVPTDWERTRIISQEEDGQTYKN